MHSERFKDEVIPLQNSLYRFAKALLHDTFEAEDAVQEVFTKLWSKKDSLAEVEKIKLRKQTVSEVEKNMLLVTDFNPHELTEIKDTAVIVQNIIKYLPEQQRLIIQLRNVEE